MILDYKKRFMESPMAKPWQDATDTEWLKSALQVALLEMMRNLPPPGDMGSASANAFRLQGAQAVVSTLLNLTEKSTTPKPINQNLDFNA